MTSAIRAGMSGMAACRSMVAATANNLANANTPGYRAQRAHMTATDGGVRTDVRRADRPGVDIARELVDLRVAETGVRANAAVIRAEDERLGTILDVFA